MHYHSEKFTLIIEQMLHLVQELEGKPDEERLPIIQTKLAEWRVPEHLQESTLQMTADVLWNTFFAFDKG